MHLPLLLLKRSTDPIWFFSGLTVGPLPTGSPYLDPNIGFTSEALGRLAAHDWLHGIIPWWNPYTGIGMPLAGELQPGAFFLPFNLLLLLPEGILWLQIAMQIIGGLSTYALMRELDLSRLAAWTGGALFCLNGTNAWVPGPAAVYCTAAFLPLLLLGIERARKPRESAFAILVIGIATAESILAGFPEPAYISALPICAWVLYRMASELEPWRIALRVVTGLVLGLLVAAPLLIAFLDYIRQSDSLGIHKLGEQSLPAAAFSMTLMPYVFGMPGTILGSFPLAHIWANIGGYTSILIVLFAIVGLVSRSSHRGLKYVLLAWIGLAFAKTFGLRPIMGLMNVIPLMKQTAFFRYAPPSWELALIILAGFALDDFIKYEPVKQRPFLLVTALLIVAIVFGWPLRAFWERPQAYVRVSFLPLVVSIAWALTTLLVAGLSWKLLGCERRRAVFAGLLVFDAAVMFMVPKLNCARRSQIDMAAIKFLQDHQGLSRIYTLGPIQPNYGAYFALPSINHNVEPVPRLWADYVESNLLPGFSKVDLSETFWAGTMPEGEGEKALSQYLTNYLNVGVRFVITKSRQDPIPTILLPNPETINQLGPGQRSRLKLLSAALQKLYAIVDDRARSARERFLARKALSLMNSFTGGSASGITTNSENSVAPVPTSVPLRSGESVKISLLAPTPVVPGAPISSVGTLIEDSGIPVDGDLTVKICVGSVCQSGHRTLAGSTGNQVFQVPLQSPLSAPGRTPLRVTFTLENGSRPISLRTLADGSTGDNQIVTSNHDVTLHNVQLAFEYGSALPGLRRVYSDSLLEVWELPNPVSYFEVIRGGPCSLSESRREAITAECAAPAILMRRELYMPGWGITLNETKASEVGREGIFQSVALQEGRNLVRYSFTPPYIGFGWAAAFVGVAGLFWQAILIWQHRIVHGA